MSKAPAKYAERANIERRSDEDAAAMASYIADMASELSQLAGRAEMPMVAYFLSLARVEAEMRSRELGGAKIKREE
ncbi:hypothetical protein ACNHKD_11070 [Methylocystis sp. JAN1]|uniref:hypothetical protein n=1 Tax=Methylocystis sp. JAN1 TaxID=3397211 RepID=UPI003FA3013C